MMDYESASGREMVRVPSTEGIVSISLSDSWTGKKLLESIGHNNIYPHGTPDELNHVRIKTIENLFTKFEAFQTQKIEFEWPVGESLSLDTANTGDLKFRTCIFRTSKTVIKLHVNEIIIE